MATQELQLINLTPGVRYRIQLYTGDQRACCSARGYHFEDGLGNASPVWTRGGLLSLIGEFTADSDTQDMWMYLEGGSSDPHITGYVLSIAGDPKLASNPDPAIDAADISPSSALSWIPGKFAAEHDVYLATRFEDVNTATTADTAYMGRQAETSYDPDALTLGETYFWRIDEVNAAPTSTVFKGDVWNFEVEPVSFAVPVGAVSATASSVDGDSDPNNAVNGAGLNENNEHSVSLEAMWSGASTDSTPWIQFEFAQLEKLDKVHVWNHNTQTESILGFGVKEALIEYSMDGDSRLCHGRRYGILQVQIGQTLDFDGIDDFVSTGKVASQLGIDGNKPRTVSVWVYTRGFANGGIFDVGARVNTEDFCLRTLDDVVDRWRVQYWGGDSDFTFNTLERWVNFVHVHDGTHTIIYGDGRTLVNWEKTINTTDTNPFQIGLYGWPGNFFYGVIDELHVYNRALTQAEALGLAGRTDPIFKEF